MNKLIPLQYIRGIAALSVLITHVMQYLKIKPFGYFWSGQYGVDVFFILSGFIIYYTIRENETFTRFIIKRVFRIYPLYLVSFVLYFSYKIIWGGEFMALEKFYKTYS